MSAILASARRTVAGRSATAAVGPGETSRAADDAPAGRAGNGRSWAAPGLVVASLTALVLLAEHDYLLFHSVVEAVAVAVGAGAFMVAWNAKAYYRSPVILGFGVAQLFVAWLTLLHLLAYRGMGVFPGGDGDLATQLWTAARLLEAGSLVAVLLMPHRPRPPTLLALYGALTALLMASIFWWHLYPRCFVTGVGLTPFKRVSEVVVVGLFLSAGALLGRPRADLDERTRTTLRWAVALAVLAEVSFSVYRSLEGPVIVAGHLLHLMVTYFFYRAVVATALQHPYGVLFGELARSEAHLRRQHDELAAAHLRLERLARVDALTGLLNRSAIRDRAGHATGDQALRAIARQLAGSLRATDALGRFGGDEFVVVLPETGAGEALAVAEKIVQAVRVLSRLPDDASPSPLTVSVGAASASAAADGLDALLHRADLAMYEAKARRRGGAVGAAVQPPA